jgi:hypothetical protein
MANISLYELDGTIDPLDKVIGTDGTTGADQGKTKNFSISGLGAYINALGVETVSTTDGTFINLTPNSQTIGDVVITADLSATGTPSSSTFLRGDNTWAVPSGLGDSTTYTLASGQPIASYVNINLSHIDEDDVTLLGVNTVRLVAGTNITLADNGSNQITISAASGIDGSGTATYIPEWADSDTLTDSFLKTDGTALSDGADLIMLWDSSTDADAFEFKVSALTRLQVQSSTVSVKNSNLVVTDGDIYSEGFVQAGTSTDTPDVTNVGAIRYRSDANNSYQEMVMQTGASTYEWVVIKQNTW